MRRTLFTLSIVFFSYHTTANAEICAGGYERADRAEVVGEINSIRSMLLTMLNTLQLGFNANFTNEPAVTERLIQNDIEVLG